MKDFKFTFEENDGYGNSTYLYIGKIRVASYYYDGGCPPKGKPYHVMSQHFDIKNEYIYHATVKNAKDMCEQIGYRFLQLLKGKK